MFSRVRVRSRKEGGDHFVERRLTGLALHARQRRVPRLKDAATLQKRCREIERLRSAQPDDAERAASGRCGNRDDGVIGGEHRCAGGTPVYFFVEMITVFMNASPMLSDVTVGSSAMARCTMRRSYGFSGPISCGIPLDRAFSATKCAICRSSASLS